MAAERRSTELRRVEIADAALKLIATRGIAELSTRLVADAVGLTTGALFRHFASMDEVLIAVVDRVDELLSAAYPPDHLPPRERIARFVDARAATVGEHVGILRLVLSEQFALALPKQAAQKLRAAVMQSRSFLEQAISEAQSRGQVRNDIPASVLTTVVMGTIQVAAFDAARMNAEPSADTAEKAVKSSKKRLDLPARPHIREGLMLLLSR
ncbi:MAG: TetR/AcrR family transcriptional regulator [Polyangiaceae bacterium]|nr:TetR/AcrR family transcriptional regulator [Polyangiaceae bacterium]